MKIFYNLDILFGQLQKRSADGTYVKKCLNAFEEEILKIRNTSTYRLYIWNLKSDLLKEHDTTNQRETVTVDRFTFTDHLSAANLICRENFQKYTKDFPQKDFEIATRCYDVLDPSKLKTELSTLYKREDICSVSEMFVVCYNCNYSNDDC
jgi:hypothetical protein